MRAKFLLRGEKKDHIRSVIGSGTTNWTRQCGADQVFISANPPPFFQSPSSSSLLLPPACRPPPAMALLNVGAALSATGSLLLHFLLPPFLVVLGITLLCASFGKSLGVRKIYVKALLQVFEVRTGVTKNEGRFLLQRSILSSRARIIECRAIVLVISKMLETKCVTPMVEPTFLAFERQLLYISTLVSSLVFTLTRQCHLILPSR